MNFQLHKTIMLKQHNYFSTKTISVPTPIIMEEDLKAKKRKLAPSEAAKATITGHFPIKPKSPPSPPILKEDRYSNLNQEEKDNNTKDKVCMGLVLSFLRLMIDIPPDRDYVEQCRLVLTRLLVAIQ